MPLRHIPYHPRLLTALPLPRPLRLPTARPFATKPVPSKDELNPTSTEYSKSGGDSAAAHSGAAFDPATTRPESETGGGGSGGGSKDGALDVSPGNQKVSRAKKEENEAVGKSSSEAGEESGRGATSERGSPRKDG